MRRPASASVARRAVAREVVGRRGQRCAGCAPARRDDPLASCAAPCTRPQPDRAVVARRRPDRAGARSTASWICSAGMALAGTRPAPAPASGGRSRSVAGQAQRAAQGRSGVRSAPLSSAAKPSSRPLACWAHRFALGRWALQAARGALEQALAEPGLQRAQALGHHRRDHAERERGARPGCRGLRIASHKFQVAAFHSCHFGGNNQFGALLLEATSRATHNRPCSNEFAPFDVTRNGVVLHGRIGGRGPALLLLHGHPQTHVIWHRVAPVLARALHGRADGPARLRRLGPAGARRPSTVVYSKREMAARCDGA